MDSIAIRSPLQKRRYQALLAAGWMILALAAGTAALPLLPQVTGAPLFGGILLAAGVAEGLASVLRRQARIPALLAAAVTVLAGVLLLLRPAISLLPILYIIAAWLLLRSGAIFLAAFRARGATRRWSLISAATDLLLGLLLIAAMAATTLAMLLFGPSPDVIASFAWFLALSLATTGLYLLEVGNCEREAASG